MLITRPVGRDRYRSSAAARSGRSSRPTGPPTTTEGAQPHAQEEAVLDDIVREFLVESLDGLDRLDADLIEVAQAPSASDTLARAFRALHTLKGTGGMLGFARLERVAHAAEDLLSGVRDGTVALSAPVLDGLRRAAAALRAMLAAIESSGDDDAADHAALVAELVALADAQVDPTVPPLGQLLIDRGLAQPQDVRDAVEAQRMGDPRRLGEILVEHGVPATAIREVLEAQTGSRDALAGERVVRVEVALLDRLVADAARLSRLASLIGQHASGADDDRLTAASADLQHLAARLQDIVHQTRVQPVGTVFGRLPRLVDDLSARCGKRVRLEVHAAGVQLDRRVIDAVRDPVLHLVRNAVDHGIEPPPLRTAAGKPEEGRLTLRADRRGDVVVLEIEDDGRGIAADRVRTKAVERGLISAAAARSLSLDDVLELIFLPGVSTAQTVTALSGRGVGLDVVRSNVRRIGGTVTVTTQAGAGTRFTIEVPAPHLGPAEGSGSCES